jgi:phosphate-selective porin
MIRKAQIIIGVTLSILVVAAAAWAQQTEKELLRNSPEFGNFQNAKEIKEKGKASLKVWENYRQFLGKDPSRVKALMRQGPGALEVAYDEIWVQKSDANPILVVARKGMGEPYHLKLYWLKNQVQAFTVEKYCTTNLLTWEKLDKPGYRIIALLGRQAILPVLTRMAAAQKTFATLTPGAHLEAAKKALAAGNPNAKDIKKRTYGRLDEARQHLAAFDRKIKEYQDEAQKLQKEVERRESDLKDYKEVMRKAGQKEMIKKREALIKDLDRDFLSKGFDVKFDLGGSDKTVLKMDCVVFSRPLVYVFVEKSNMLGRLRDAGFAEVVFSNKKINYKWDIDLNN